MRLTTQPQHRKNLQRDLASIEPPENKDFFAADLAGGQWRSAWSNAEGKDRIRLSFAVFAGLPNVSAGMTIRESSCSLLDCCPAAEQLPGNIKTNPNGKQTTTTAKVAREEMVKILNKK